MNNMKSRSSLKKVTKAEVEAARTPRRRISFSGKKFIREFDTTEKARDYDNSYEISDHTNGDDSSGQSHVSAAASALQVTAHISLANEMDKENTPLVSVKESILSEYDQSHRNDFTLQLQTSVNVTLMPHELAKKRQTMDLSAPLESIAFDSLSLSDAERDRLRESSMFKMPINDKTMDLIPHKMAMNELHSNTIDKEYIQKTILTATDMSCVAPKEKDIKQKTVVFENNDITCDFTDIAPPPVVAATTEQTTYESFNMQENDSLNYLPDDSTSSPLIPLDVISENGISRKLNFRQLNEALNAGRIQLFPNGPRTPNTDRIVKPSRFWHGLEQQPMEEEIPLREAIKPRGTLNFNESMTMSPISEQPQSTTNKSDKASDNKELPGIKQNNRFSQADELMLDNTNFLAHAKMGDETQSRNSSKSASRRETTYDNTAMELDDLEKQEAAVVAALEKAARRPQLQRLVDENEDYSRSAGQDLANKDPISGKDQHENQKLSRTMKLNETMEEDCTKQPVKEQEQEYVIRRQTIHFIKDIDEDATSPSKESPARAEHQTERRRQTLHFAEDIDEEMPSPRHESHHQSIAHPVKQHTSQRRQTLHLAEPIEEDADDAEDKVKSTASPVPERRVHQRQTICFAEDIDEDRHSPTKMMAASSRRRQTLHMAESIEEDLYEPCKDLKSQPAKDSDQKHWTKRRQTVHMAETIEEDVVQATKDDCHIKQPPSAVVRRQTLLFSEDIEEELLRPEQEFQLNSIVSQNEKQSCSRRQTLLLSEPIEEEVIKPPPAEQQSRRRKTVQMVEPIEVDIIKPQTSTAVVEPIAKSIDEDMLSPLKDLHISTTAPKLEKQISRRRQTLHTAEPIEEDFCGQEEVFMSQPVTASEEQLSTRRRQTIPVVVPIEEDVYSRETKASENIMELSADIDVDSDKTQQGLQLSEMTPLRDQQCIRRRQTVHRVDPIEEDSFTLHNNLMSPQTTSCGNQQRTLYLKEEIVEEPVQRHHKPQTERKTNFSPEAETISKPRQTIHLSEPIVEEACVTATMMKEDEIPRQAPNKSERNKVDLSVFELSSASPTKTKPRQTLCMAVDMDEDMPKASGTNQRRNKSRMTFLEDFDSESSSTNLEKNSENTSQESQSDSGKWLTQMNAKLRKTLVNPIKDEVSKSIINPTIGNRTSMETPQSHRTRRGCFPITPGRSIIEYEDLEEMCNIESPAPPAAAPTNYHLADMDLDMDVSNYGTPIGIAKTSTSFNSKRLPIHLTPNLPEPKKRSKQFTEKQKDQETSLLLDATMRDEEQPTPTAVNGSCLPRPCQTSSSNSPWQDEEQLDGTVQMVRAQLMRQTRSFFDTNAICPTENKMQLEETTAAVFENNPITISDVSTHFAAQKELAKQSLANPAKDPKNISSNSRSSNENSNKSYVRAHKKFINLSGDTVIFDAVEIIDLASDDNEIEKTRLSLVETLLDDEEGDIRDESDNHLEVVPVFETETETEPDACLSQLIPPTVAGTADACKKCKHCRRSVDGARESVSDTFVLPNWNALDQGLQRLKRLRQQPRLAEVHKYWELKKLARYSNASDNISVMNVDANDNEQFPTLTEMLEMFNKKLENCKRRLPEPVVVKPYVELLTVKLCDQVPNWIFDHQLECDHQYILSHTKITTFRIVISYVPMDDMETEIRVQNIKAMTATTIQKSNWSEYEHLMDFQVRLRLPLNLLNLLDGNGVDDIVKFMQHVDTICMETRQMCNDMHLLLLSKEARLLRQSNRAIVRKSVRRMFHFKDEAYMRVEKINFVIEIGNIEEISFKDILQPPLYQFDQKIQFFPKGLGFLKAFLTNPEQYLKPMIENNN